MSKFWMMPQCQLSIMKKFEEFLGEELEEEYLSECEKKFYTKYDDIMKRIFKKEDDLSEKEYINLFTKEVEEVETKEEKITFENREYIRKRLGVNGAIIDIKKRHLKEDINDLAKYMRDEDCVVGILISVRKKDYVMYLLLKEYVLEGIDYICYNGEKIYKYIIKEQRTSEKKKEEKERIKQIMTKERIKEWIDQGKGYIEISKLIGVHMNKIKEFCIKNNIEKLYNTDYIKEKKQIPHDYIEILNNEEKKKAKIEDCKREMKKEIESEKEIREECGIYGIINKRTKECIYVGSTNNYIKRLKMHKEKYEEGYKQKVFEVIREEGGWDNFIFIPLEKRETHIGLNVIERIWWQSLQPRCNSFDPLKTN